MSEQRKNVRFTCQVSAEIHAHGTLAKWGVVTDISKSGSYVETASPLALQEEFVLVLHAFDLTISLKARVATVYPMIGMGVEFEASSPEDEKSLDALLTRLAAMPAADKTETKAPLPPSPPLRISPHQAGALVKEIEKHFREHSVLSREQLSGILRRMDTR